MTSASASPEQRQLPPVRAGVVPDDEEIAGGILELEVSMLWGDPAIEDLRDLDPAVLQHDHARRFFAAVPGVAFDGDA
jgi:hypothetical protein